MRILYFGTQSVFSLPPLSRLLQSEHVVAGVVVPEKHNRQITPPTHLATLPMLNNDTIITLAWAHNIPVYGVRASLPAADVIVVACFPKRLTERQLRHPRRAALNIHPSWLPDYRGPVPLFWQLRDGLTRLGVTLHHMTAEFDRGDIVAQAHIRLPDGSSGPEADQLLASAGADLLLEALEGDLPGMPQGEGSYQSWPMDHHWDIPTSWTVLRAFNFMRGVAEWGQPFRLLTNQGWLRAHHARRYRRGQSVPGAVETVSDGQAVGFADGWLVVK